MPMAISFSDQYPISPDQLRLIFADANFFTQRFVETGILAYKQLAFDVSDDAMDIAFRLTTPIEIPKGIPKAATKLLPAEQVMDYSMTWQRSRQGWTASYCYTVKNKPITITGTRHVQACESGCESEVEFHVNANIPVFGKILAETLEKRIRLELEADEAALKAKIEGEVEV